MNFISKVFWEFPLTACVFIFLYVFYAFSLVFLSPEVISQNYLSYPGQFVASNMLLSTMFHASFPHLFTNSLFLLFLGRVAEAKVGKKKWLLYYFMAGFISVFLDSVIRGLFMGSKEPVVGASGAISGLAAVSALLSPYKVVIAGKNIYFPVFLVAWVLVYSDFVNLFSSDHVAHWAHLAGFFSVFLTSYLLGKDERSDIRKGFLLNLLFFTLTVILLFLFTQI